MLTTCSVYRLLIHYKSVTLPQSSNRSDLYYEVNYCNDDGTIIMISLVWDSSCYEHRQEIAIGWQIISTSSAKYLHS